MPQILGFIEALAELKAALLDTALDALEPILQGIGDVLGTVVLPALTMLADFLAENFHLVQGIGIAIVTLLVPAFVAWAVAAGTAAVATIVATGPIILLGAAIAGLAALVIIHFDTIKGVILGVFNWIRATGRSSSSSSLARSDAIGAHRQTLGHHLRGRYRSRNRHHQLGQDQLAAHHRCPVRSARYRYRRRPQKLGTPSRPYSKPAST